MITQAIDIVKTYGSLLLTGTLRTIVFAFSGTIIGFIIGLITGVVKTTPLSRNKLVAVVQRLINFIINVYVEVIRGTPMMVQAMVIYWGFAYMSGGITLDLDFAAIFIISFNTGAYMTEIVRGGIISIDNGQFEGAYSLGMTHTQAMIHVVFPQVIRNILPGASNEFVNNIKDSSVLNVIGAAELFYFTGVIKSKTFMTFQSFLVASVIYLIVTFTATRLLRILEKVLEGDKNFEVVDFNGRSDLLSVPKKKEGQR